MLPSHARDPVTESLPSGGGLPNHRRAIRDLPEVLDVVAVLSNPCRFASRYNNFRAFERHMRASGVRLTVVECAFGSRPWEVTEAGNPRHVRLRTDNELWVKENLLNVGVAHLPRGWRWVACVDADVTFARPDWVQETLHQLQHYAVVQMFSDPLGLRADGTPDPDFCGDGRNTKSWGYCHAHGLQRPRMAGGGDGIATDGYGYGYGAPRGLAAGPGDVYWHPGYAWAYRREAWEALGGMLDVSILGAGDYHMALALTGHLARAAWMSDGYWGHLDRWRKRADAHIKGDVGYVPGLVLHHWHGPKSLRRYRDRWQVMAEARFDPDRHLVRDWQGVWRLGDEAPRRLRDELRTYFRERDEDS